MRHTIWFFLFLWIRQLAAQSFATDPSQWRRSGIFIVNFEHISHLVLVFLLLTLNM